MALARIGGNKRLVRKDYCTAGVLRGPFVPVGPGTGWHGIPSNMKLYTGLNILIISAQGRKCCWRPIMLVHEYRILLDRLSIQQHITRAGKHPQGPHH